MKHKLLSALGLIVLGMVALGVSQAYAETAAGPYYAMPSWDQTLPASTRFIVLSNMGSAAVLDRETGLVWEQSPSTGAFNWKAAQIYCTLLTVGNRRAWRLPTIHELASLVDPSVAPPGPTLPSGHPFSNVQSSTYWSATTDIDLPTVGLAVAFISGIPVGEVKDTERAAWCVRGGPGVVSQ
jgi:hypothetical protein